MLVFVFAVLLGLGFGSTDGVQKLNSKTRFPGRIEVERPALLDWVGWSSENFTAAEFTTVPMGPGEFTRTLALTSWFFRIPKDSKIKGLQFTVDQCSMEMHHDWSVIVILFKKYPDGGSTLLSAPEKVRMNAGTASTSCFGEERSVVVGSSSAMWGQEPDVTDFDTEFGVRFQVLIDPETTRDLRNHNGTHEDTTAEPTTSATTAASTASSSSASTSSTSSTPTTAAPTLPAKKASISFRNPKFTITYDAPCDLDGLPGVWCSDDGESVISAPTRIDGNFRIPRNNTLILDMQEYRAAMPAPPASPKPFVTVTGEVVLGGKLVLAFSKSPDIDKLESWILFDSESSRISGAFDSVTANITDMNWFQEQEVRLCERFNIVTQSSGRLYSVTTQKHNICWDTAKSHPGVTAAIVLSVLGIFLTAAVLFVLWRKRRFERSRAAVLSSPLTDEAEMQEMRMADTKSYSEAAKMIESTSGRFEIGDDDIDDPQTPEL